MAEEKLHSPQAFAALVRTTLIKGFALPVCLLIFFAVAPAWLEHKLHSDVRERINEDSELSSEAKSERITEFTSIRFEEVCGGTSSERERLRAGLETAGICGQFQRLHWGFALSVALLVGLAGVTLTTFVLNRRASHSPAKLIESYRLAWRLSIGAALTKVLLLMPLLAYGTFELSTLATGSYYPKLIAIVVIGGVIALWRGIKVLLQPVPLEFNEAIARAVAPEEAPALWQEVKAAASRLGTTAPDNILVGMQLNFYVTELAVNYLGGRAQGRTLYLSFPLLHQLAPDEVMAIIGHELGHFRGDDTRITREFYPLRFKVGATLQALGESGWVGWPSLHALLFFHWSFGRTEQGLSRERELLADRAAAELTSASTAARALLKVQVLSEAFDRNVISNPKRDEQNVFAASLLPYIRSELTPQKEFWTQLFEKGVAHPLDSHPSLRDRLEALQQSTDPDLAVGTVTAETELAYARWFAGHDQLFAGLVEEANEQFGRIRSQLATVHADYKSDAGRQLLDQQFPEIRWKSRAVSLWIKLIGCAIGAIVLGLMACVMSEWSWKLPLGAVTFLLAAECVLQWRRHHRGEFILRADSLAYTGWTRPVTFAEVTRISSSSSYSTVTVTFHFGTRQTRFSRYSWLKWLPTKSVSLPTSLIAAKQKIVLAALHRYIARETEP